MTWTTREKVMAVILAAVIIIASAAVLVATYRIRSTGKIKAVGIAVFWDPQATSPCTEIDWGILGAGDLAGATVFIRNTKNVNCTLSINGSDWQPPEAEQYLTLDWNYTGEILQPQQIVSVQITLYAGLNVTGFDTFSFDIVITATESKPLLQQLA